MLIVQLIDVRNSVRPTSLNAAQLACISIMSASIRSHQLDYGCLVVWLFGCWLVGWLFGCFFSWLVGLSWLIGGWLVDS